MVWITWFIDRLASIIIALLLTFVILSVLVGGSEVWLATAVASG